MVYRGSSVFFIALSCLVLSTVSIRMQPVIEAYDEQCLYEHFSTFLNIQRMRRSIDSTCPLKDMIIS